ncbi:MAG: hypothetical protein PHS57_01285 [Alphaproteobacteria bacterium]|nr:hypothetical protein [Alphaproteobacteria bacterium]
MDAAPNIVNFALTKGLSRAFESIIMPSVVYGGALAMPEAEKVQLTAEERNAVLDPFSNPEAWKSLWMKAGACAQQKAVEENDRLGLDSHGTINGRLAVKNPDGTVTFVEKFEL